MRLTFSSAFNDQRCAILLHLIRYIANGLVVSASRGPRVRLPRSELSDRCLFQPKPVHRPSRHQIETGYDSRLSERNAAEARCPIERLLIQIRGGRGGIRPNKGRPPITATVQPAHRVAVLAFPKIPSPCEFQPHARF
jgi:hypothetical protein